MLIEKSADIRYSEIAPKHIYMNRRNFLAGVPAAFLGARELLSPSGQALAGTKLQNVQKSKYTVDEKQNSYQDVSTYNNYYEFGTDKSAPVEYAKNFKTAPWTVSVEGACNKPRNFTMEEILALAPLEERVYRHRCVEAWSIVVPWVGYSLSALLNKVEPTSKANYVAFETFFDRRQMPHAAGLQFPYVEGLRMDEAMHPLALLCTGMFGEALPPQDGAPVRMILPWKYGFKSIKSIVKIRLVGSMPPTSWSQANPPEYGFYSNVNPKVDHPRWSQASERRLGEFRRRATLMFNGYGDQVASLYSGMDLQKNY
jgi:sulfoxide reductase catalytic subunit YedY